MVDDNDEYLLKNIIVNSEKRLKYFDKEESNKIRNDIIYNVNNKLQLNNNGNNGNKRNTCNKFIRLNEIKKLQQKLEKNKVIVIKSDKSNTPVLMKLEQYSGKMYDYINENGFQEIRNPTAKYLKIVKNMIVKYKNTLNHDNRIKYHTRLYPFHPDAPILSGLPKIHKDGIPFRPLINFKSAPSYNIAKIMDKIIRKKLNIRNDYSIKNGYELIEKLKKLKINKKTKIVSYDIVNMYSNIPVNETIEIIKNQLLKTENINEVNNIITIIRNICMQNYFTFDNKFYLQEEGLPMGMPLSAVMAEIYLNRFEEYIVKGITHVHEILLWGRYVDDILTIYNSNITDEHIIIKNKLNSYNEKLQFTVETETRGSMSFLDINIILDVNSGNIKTGVYHKPISNNTTIHNNSNHPWAHKVNTYYNMINRAYTYIGGNKEELNKELQLIESIANQNGYDDKFINNIHRKYFKKMHSKTKLIPQNNNKNKKYITYNYTNKNINRIVNVYNKDLYTIAFKSNKSIIKYFNKQQNDNMYNLCGIYKIVCDDCDSIYIGKTNRSFKQRFNEHFRAYKNRNKYISNVADHLVNNDHRITSMQNNMEIIEIVHSNNNENNMKLEQLEKYYIYKFKSKNTLMNHQTVFEQDGLFKLIQ